MVAGADFLDPTGGQNGLSRCGAPVHPVAGSGTRWLVGKHWGCANNEVVEKRQETIGETEFHRCSTAFPKTPNLPLFRVGGAFGGL